MATRTADTTIPHYHHLDKQVILYLTYCQRTPLSQRIGWPGAATWAELLCYNQATNDLQLTLVRYDIPIKCV